MSALPTDEEGNPAATVDALGKTLASLSSSPTSTVFPSQLRDASSADQAIRALREQGDQERFRLGATLGEGGMGIVRQGRQLSLGRDVAIKTLKETASTSDDAIKLLREAWITGALEHPNIVPVYDLSLDGSDRPHIVLKKIAGQAWSALMHDPLRIRSRFHADDAFDWNVRILLQVSSAIHFAHTRGILHRDLKPDNVMIGQFGEVYVLDWGIAVALRDEFEGRLPLASDACELAGTPSYMAPEMLGAKVGSALSERTDVYLLGAILAEIVLGRPPHEGESFSQLVLRILESNPVLPSDTPSELARIIRTAMDPDPAARFENVEQFRLAVSAFLSHRGSLALSEEATVRCTWLRQAISERPREGEEAEAAIERIHHLFGEARFGFLQALKVWPQNEEARIGLERALTDMIEFELERDDPHAAARLMLEMSSTPSELAERVRERKRSKEQVDARRLALERDQDTSVGRQTRVFLAAVLGCIWTAGPFSARIPTALSLEPTTTFFAMMALLFSVPLGLWFWARDSMGKSAVNRRAAGLTLMTLLSHLIVGASGVLRGAPLSEVQSTFMLLSALGTAAGGVTVDRRIFVSSLVFVLGFFFAGMRPESAEWIHSAANFVLLCTLLVIWASPRDLAREFVRRSDVPEGAYTRRES